MTVAAVGVSPQLVEVVLLLLLPAMAGVAVFLIIWLLLRQPLQGVLERLFSAGGASRQISKAAETRLGPSDANGILGWAAHGDGVGQRSDLADAARDGPAVAPRDAARREHHLAEWRRAEAEFLREPAEAVGRAERLLSELARERGAAPVAGALMQRSRPGAVRRPTGFEGDAEFGAALADAAVGIFRLIRHPRLAAHGRHTTPERQGVSAGDLRERMDLYRGVVGRLLQAEHGESHTPRAVAPAAFGGEAGDRRGRPHQRSAGTFAEWAAREWTSARWHVLQLLLSLAFGFAVLVLLLWVLSL
jgi:hypothetical protein